MELFPKEQIVGVFRGFREGGLEFHADLVLPYRNDFQRIPMHGQFVLVQLETPEEAVLGRIASFSSEGKLSRGSGEEFNIRAVQEDRTVPEDLREQYLKYRINIRVLGVLRNGHANALTFVPSHRRLPHVGSAVAFPSGEVLQEICGHNLEGAAIGYFALGEYIYADGKQAEVEPWMRLQSPEVLVRFPMESLVARRSFVFARAGFGKSNLNKLLFSKLYEKTPTVQKRGDKHVPVGTVIFDPDGEYFWPDDKNRPGFCDVPHLQDKVVVFTPRQAPSDFYGSFIAGGIKLDIRQLRPSDVISIALSPERQDQQNVAKLRALPPDKWADLVDLIDRHKGTAQLDEVAKIMTLELPRQDAEAIAARSNMTNVVGMLHDRSSQFMGLLVKALEAGKICVVDISQMRGAQSFILAGLILRRLFDRNQEEFIKADPRTIPTIAVIEEAQTVLNERATAAEPYLAWVKEGRKYDLGALLITQQPGSIPNELLSQGDNWFIFHLLSSSDLSNAKRANAHFSDDLLSSLLNEPIPGQGVFWSSVGGKPYPVSIRALSFEELYEPADPSYSRCAVPTFADELRTSSAAVVEAARATLEQGTADHEEIDSARPSSGIASSPSQSAQNDEEEEGLDLEEHYRRAAVEAIRKNQGVMNALVEPGVKWSRLKFVIRDNLPDTLDDRDAKAFQLIRPTLETVLGVENQQWHTFRDESRVLHVRKAPK